MVNYDSDSSEGADQDYTETNVLLGYASKEASESDDINSFIGGRPVSASYSATCASREKTQQRKRYQVY